MESKLKEKMSYIPDGIIRKLIGQSICDAIVNYNLYNENLKVDYIEILLNKFGDKILFEKDIFANLILFLPTKITTTIAQKAGLIYKNDEDARNKIIKKGFGFHNIDFSILVLSELDLDKNTFLASEVYENNNYQTRLVPEYSLHNYQKNIKDKAIQYLLSVEHSKRLLIHMPTGAGKTKTAMEILCDYLRSRSVLGGFEKSTFVVWLAHSKELCDQAFETFSQTWKLRGDSEIDLFKIYGEHNYDEQILKSESAVLFVGFQKFNSLLNSKNPQITAIKKRIVDKVKLVIVDEAHKSLAVTYEKAISFLTESYAGVQLIGLTATPGRNSDHEDEENNLLAYFFNSTKLGLIDDLGVEIVNPIKHLQDLGVLAEIEREELITDVQIEIAEKQIRDLKIFGDEKLYTILNDLSVHPGRNNLIIEKVKELAKKRDSILIFACNVEHCIILQTLLKSYNIDSRVITGDTKKNVRENSIQKFKAGDLQVLINYGVLTTGFDAPNLNALIITRPTSSLVLYSQMVGRALRGPLNGGNKKNKLIDLRDNWNLGTENIMFDFYNNIWI